MGWKNPRRHRSRITFLATAGMTSRTIAFFAMAQRGHFESLLPLISALAERGHRVHVFSDGSFQREVAAAGGSLTDMLARYPVEAADGESLPAPCRYVTYASVFSDRVAAEARALRPDLIVYDAHAPIGRVVAELLGIPSVSVCPAHDVHPERVDALVATLPAVRISDACRSAVDRLESEFGLDHTSPFSFASWVSPHLNIYGEPPAFLGDDGRRALEPVAFHGCLPGAGELAGLTSRGATLFPGSGKRLRIYVSFGTVVRRYFPEQALGGIRTLAAHLAARDDVSALISTGGAGLGEAETARLSGPNVAVRDYVDQWRALGEADVFITHNGLKSTHEAIWAGVPMLSYPFFWDQPALAERCRGMGLAIPLADALTPLSGAVLDAALDALEQQRPSLVTALDEAKRMEEELIGRRELVLDRMLGLA